MVKVFNVLLSKVITENVLFHRCLSLCVRFFLEYGRHLFNYLQRGGLGYRENMGFI